MNMGGGHRITVNELIGHLRGITRSTSEVLFSNKQIGDAKHTLADVGLAERKIRYRPEISIEKGLGMFVDWYRNNGSM